jgi:hypothetical protein
LLVALDDSINAKSGRKVFACQRSFGVLPARLRELRAAVR